jgi:hypothetical protein
VSGTKTVTVMQKNCRHELISVLYLMGARDALGVTILPIMSISEDTCSWYKLVHGALLT